MRAVGTPGQREDLLDAGDSDVLLQSAIAIEHLDLDAPVLANAGTAMSFPSGDHEPDEVVHDSASKWASEFGLVRWCRTLPVFASTISSSRSNTSRVVDERHLGAVGTKHRVTIEGVDCVSLPKGASRASSALSGPGVREQLGLDRRDPQLRQRISRNAQDRPHAGSSPPAGGAINRRDHAVPEVPPMKAHIASPYR